MSYNISKTQEKNRLEYIDSLRGVAMLCVMYFHICIYLLGESTDINESLWRWQMPLFFFISGFFAYAPVYDAQLLKKNVYNRLTKQFYPTVVVWFIFLVCRWSLSDAPFEQHLLHGIYDSAKVGYWFTYSLMQVFLLYVVIAFLLSHFRTSVTRQTFIYIILICGFFALGFFYDEGVFTGVIKKFWNVLSWGKSIGLVSFFFGGVVVRMHWKYISEMIRHYMFTVICLVLFMVSSLLSPTKDDVNTVTYLVSRIAGMMFMVSLFVCIGRYVDHTTSVGRYLQRIGRNTLPIYLFHFFILLLVPYLIDDFGGILRRIASNPASELISFTALSMIFAEITLVVDNALKKIPYAYTVVFAK